MRRRTMMVVWAGAWLAGGLRAAEPALDWVTAEAGGRVEVRRGGAVVFGWQRAPLERPKGGARFAASAFVHPLRTPSGFECTVIQPADHLHHFGLWWPWKFIEVDGTRHNVWEIQEGQGGVVAREAKLLENKPGRTEWEFVNEVLVRKPGAEPRAVIREKARVGFSAKGADAHVVDFLLDQRPLGGEVKIVDYHYSGFSWRGPAAWNKGNSRMTTSGGQGRDEANGKPAKWVVVSGPTPAGTASVLLMSAATEVAGTEERLRVWDSKMGNGTPFVNFNPVVGGALPLDEAHPAVSRRKYRVVAADRLIDAAAAEVEWREWAGKAPGQ